MGQIINAPVIFETPIKLGLALRPILPNNPAKLKPRPSAKMPFLMLGR